MQNSKLTPVEELKEKISRAKKQYVLAVTQAKNSFRFRTATPEMAAKLIDKFISEKSEQGPRLFYNEEPKKRLLIARALLKKAISIKARVQPSSYLSMSTLRMTGPHYNIYFRIRPKIEWRYDHDFKEQPSQEAIISLCKEFFPSIKKVEL